MTEIIARIRRHNPLTHAPQTLGTAVHEFPSERIHGTTEMIRNMVGRQKQEVGLWTHAMIAHMKEGRGLGEIIHREVMLHQAIDLADRGVNGLLDDLSYDPMNPDAPSEFGEVLHRARENHDLDDHNGGHGRRVEHHLEGIVLNTPELRFAADDTWIDSQLLVAQFHDADQLLSMQRNLDEDRVGTDGELQVKRGHSFAGAVMMMALTPRYAQSRHIPVDDAWEKTAAAAIMTIRHDDLSKFNKAITATGKPYHELEDGKESLSDEELYDAYARDELDYFLLSPHDLIRLLQIEKRKYGFADPEDPDDLGLHPAFQREYRAELDALRDDHRPLFADISEVKREQITLAAQEAIMADVLDMVTPAIESQLRTFLTQYSRQRPFMVDVDPEEFTAFIQSWDGNPTGGYNCDAARLCWEFLNQDKPIEGTALEHTPYMRHMMKDNAMMGAIAFREIGVRVMAGDLDIVDDLYAARDERLARKAVRKARLPGSAAFRFRQMIQRSEDPSAAIGAVLKISDPALKIRYETAVTHLRQERETVKQNFRDKPYVANGERRYGSSDVRIYEPHEIEQFQTVMDEIVALLRAKYDVDEDELSRYSQMVSRGVHSRMPYHSYDSLGSPADRRVIMVR